MDKTRVTALAMWQDSCTLSRRMGTCRSIANCLKSTAVGHGFRHMSRRKRRDICQTPSPTAYVGRLLPHQGGNRPAAYVGRLLPHIAAAVLGGTGGPAIGSAATSHSDKRAAGPGACTLVPSHTSHRDIANHLNSTAVGHGLRHKSRCLRRTFAAASGRQLSRCLRRAVAAAARRPRRRGGLFFGKKEKCC